MKANYKNVQNEPEGDIRTILAGLDVSRGLDKATLVVGKKQPRKQVEPINLFTGKEAIELWEKLTKTKVK